MHEIITIAQSGVDFLTWDKVVSASGGTVLVLVVVAFIKGWIVSGPQAQREIDRIYKLYEDQVVRADKCEQRMIDAMTVARDATMIATSIADKHLPPPAEDSK